jgi:hypothetical protein
MCHGYVIRLLPREKERRREREREKGESKKRGGGDF